MRMKRIMRSSSSTTRMRRRSKLSGMLFPHEADDLLFFRTFKDLDQGDFRHRPDYLDHVMFKVMEFLAVAQARVGNGDDRVGGLGKFFYFTGDSRLSRDV